MLYCLAEAIFTMRNFLLIVRISAFNAAKAAILYPKTVREERRVEIPLFVLKMTLIDCSRP